MSVSKPTDKIYNDIKNNQSSDFQIKALKQALSKN